MDSRTEFCAWAILIGNSAKKNTFLVMFLPLFEKHFIEVCVPSWPHKRPLVGKTAQVPNIRLWFLRKRLLNVIIWYLWFPTLLNKNGAKWGLCSNWCPRTSLPSGVRMGLASVRFSTWYQWPLDERQCCYFSTWDWNAVPTDLHASCRRCSESWQAAVQSTSKST